jgi:tetratricopeptide (TPR) repeat protein
MQMRRDGTFRISLSDSKKRIACRTAVLFLSISYAAVAAAHFAALELSNRISISHLQWASRLDPWNGKYHDLLGRYQMFARNRPDLAISSFHEAVTLNPYSSRYWLDLASADYLLENHDEADFALLHAASADPKTPDTAWESANLYVTLGEPARALQQFHAVLEGDPALRNHALVYCWRLNPNAAVLLREAIPPEATADFLEFLIAKNEWSGAADAWGRLIQLRQPTERQHVFNYLQFLLARRDFAQAKAVWSQSAAVAGLAPYQPSAQNLIVNGDFRFAVLNAGFDWRYQKQPGVSLSLDPTQVKGGVRSLEVSFDSPGIEDAGISQLIPVDPNAQYELSANFRSEDLRGAGGPRFVIQDFVTGLTYYAGDDLKSDLAWSHTRGIFSTGPDAQILLLRIGRVPAGNAIRGKLWIDSVNLRSVRTIAEVRQ